MAHKLLPPPITRDERGVAREIRALADRGKTTSEILMQWPQFDAHFVERALSDPTIKDEVREAGARRKRIRKIEKKARENPPLLPVGLQALPRTRVTLCEAVTWLATGKACSGKEFIDDIPDDVQTGQKIELAGCLLLDAFGENELPMFGYRVNDHGEPSVETEQIPSEKSLSRSTTTAPPIMGLVDDTISIGGTTYEGVTMRRSDLLRLWPASTPAGFRPNSTVDVGTVSQAPPPIPYLAARSAFPSPAGRPDTAADGADHDAVSLGRPTLEPEIKAAYKELLDARKIDFDAPKNRLYEPIREKVQEYKGDPSLQRGLGNEAIRKVISPLFEAEKNARPTSP